MKIELILRLEELSHCLNYKKKLVMGRDMVEEIAMEEEMPMGDSRDMEVDKVMGEDKDMEGAKDMGVVKDMVVDIKIEEAVITNQEIMEMDIKKLLQILIILGQLTVKQYL